MNDHLARAMAAKGKLRAVACVTTSVVNDICFLQGCSPVVSVALGRAVSGAALLGSTLKQGQRLAIKFEGNGPMQKLIAEVDWDGALRATVAVPDAVAESVPDALGRAGFLTVTKDLGLKEPYSGMVQLYTSEIAQDLAYYLTDSDQIPSAVGLGVSLAPDGQVAVAGGFLIQSLPPSDESAVEQVMTRIEQLPPLTTLLAGGTSPTALLELLLEGLEYNLLESTDLSFRCGCSLDKVERALLSLGKEELERLMAEQGSAEVTCEFCRRQYRLDRELPSLLERLQ
ncbi:Hsp33 family molecular chaperone HslO [Trichlorobacter sp.]|uniref:Hsp33 family molecular chaperone HslO n=1 Tax=Trichlorobacter sp. TaxID=2911007 RepID=UPI002A364084|nr:Hsp33 family molecular chaperone HslO [Trichlorobacter sp.]MDY0384263.1 Hsp33 family molecular chaperone HslO [Trichlorobacter sp.]